MNQASAPPLEFQFGMTNYRVFKDSEGLCTFQNLDNEKYGFFTSLEVNSVEEAQSVVALHQAAFNRGYRAGFKNAQKDFRSAIGIE